MSIYSFLQKSTKSNGKGNLGQTIVKYAKTIKDYILNLEKNSAFLN